MVMAEPLANRERKDRQVQVRTRELGVVEVAPDQVFDFAGPILGFESYRQYVLVEAADAPPFYWLQSTVEQQLAFPVVNASELAITYDLGTEAMRKLGVNSPEDVSFWIIVTVPAEGGEMRVNLRAPVVINHDTRTAAQVIMQEEYPVSCDMVGCKAG